MTFTIRGGFSTLKICRLANISSHDYVPGRGADPGILLLQNFRQGPVGPVRAKHFLSASKRILKMCERSRDGARFASLGPQAAPTLENFPNGQITSL